MKLKELPTSQRDAHMGWGPKRHTLVIKIRTRRGVTKMHTCLMDGLTHRDKHTQKDVRIEVRPI